ncbi:MAG: PDDEXK nuclease domain-containing protein, partial [Lachnospiraceae bacterium]|nr:PDDEXK nuclease domain-containing protein [Lachnospiraceae bacterium]
MDEIKNYDEAVEVIKLAILRSQYDAAKSVNEKQLMLYFAVGKYISMNSRKGFWGKGAIDTISEKLSNELPGLHGFSPRNLRYMRSFYEEWKILDRAPGGILALASAKTEDDLQNELWHLQVPNEDAFPAEEFLSIGFTQHRTIFEKTKDVDERCYYIRRCAYEKYSVSELKESILREDYKHQGKLSNNFIRTINTGRQALKAIDVFKDEYLLDYINVEELSSRDDADIDEKVLENAIVHNVKNFILTFGKDFAFVRNQYHLDAFGENQFIDLLFFNRELNCLVAVELKKGKFKTSYLGQLQGYLSVLDGFEKKPHENPSIGLILCKDMNKSYV